MIYLYFKDYVRTGIGAIEGHVGWRTNLRKFKDMKQCQEYIDSRLPPEIIKMFRVKDIEVFDEEWDNLSEHYYPTPRTFLDLSEGLIAVT